MFEAPAKDGCGDGCLTAIAVIALGGVVMCIPKRSPAEQRAHDAAMRAINRGRRHHPCHHNLRPIYLAACLAVAVFGAAVMVAAAFFMQSLPAVATPLSGATRPVPGSGLGTSGSQSAPPQAPNPPGGRVSTDSPDVPPT